MLVVGHNLYAPRGAAFLSADPARGWEPLEGIPFEIATCAARASGPSGRVVAAGLGDVGPTVVVEISQDDHVRLLPTAGLTYSVHPGAVAATDEPWQVILGQSTSDTTGGIFFLRDPEGPWVQADAGLPDLTSRRASAIHGDPLRPGLLLGLTSEGAQGSGAFRQGFGVYRWSAALEAWESLPLPLRGMETTAFAADPYCVGGVYVGTMGGGVFRTVVGD